MHTPAGALNPPASPSPQLAAGQASSDEWFVPLTDRRSAQQAAESVNAAVQARPSCNRRSREQVIWGEDRPQGDVDVGNVQARSIPSAKGGRITPASVMMAVISSCGVTSKAGFQTATPSGAVRVPPTWVTSSGARSSMGIALAVGERWIDRGEGGGDVEGDPVRPGEDRQAVGPDLVGRIAVGGDPVRPDDDQIDLPLLHQKSRHVVRDQRAGDPLPQELPGGQPRPLEDGAGLVGVHMDLLPLFGGRPDHAERRPVTGGGERPGVAVGEDPGPVRDQPAAGSPEPAVGCDVLLADPDRLGDEALPDRPEGIAVRRRRGIGQGVERRVAAAPHPLDRPEEVPGRRARWPRIAGRSPRRRRGRPRGWRLRWNARPGRSPSPRRRRWPGRPGS